MSIFNEDHITIPEWMDSDEIYKSAGLSSFISKSVGKAMELSGSILNSLVQMFLPSINILTGHDISDTEVYKMLQEEIENLLVKDKAVKSELWAIYVTLGKEGVRNRFFQIVHDRLSKLKKYAADASELKAIEAILTALAKRYNNIDFTSYKTTEKQEEQNEPINDQYEPQETDESEHIYEEGEAQRPDINYKQCSGCHNYYPSSSNFCSFCGKPNEAVNRGNVNLSQGRDKNLLPPGNN